MAIRALKCPSCGADITLDDSREYGFCSYCGSQIQVGEQVHVHVTHEYKGDTPDINVTNQYFYMGQDNDSKPSVVIEKPGSKKLGWGIALGLIGIIGLFSSGGKELSYILICLAFIVISAFLFISHFKAMRIYEEAVRNASKNGVVYKEQQSKKGKR